MQYLFGLFLLLMSFTPLYSGDKTLFVKKIERYLDQQIKDDGTPGAVLLISSPKLGMIRMAVGQAMLSPQLDKMTTHHNFRVASISKTYLAVMILKLVEQGKIKLDLPIKHYLPNTIDLSLIQNLDKITTRQLLTMTSGIPEYYDLDVDDYLSAYPYKGWYPQDALYFSADLQPKFAPGEGYEYSNTNYVLLQLILQNVTQKNLALNLSELICLPLNLSQTFADDFKMSGFTLTTKGYDTKREPIDVSKLDDGFGIGDTFVITNADELHHFLKALLIDKNLLKPKSLKMMLQANAFGRYGMGIEVSHAKYWGKIYSHNGLVNGYQSNYFYIPKYKLIIIILTNNRATTLIEPVFIKILNSFKSLILKN